MLTVQMDSTLLHVYLERVFPDPVRGADPARYEKASREVKYARSGAEYMFSEGRGNKAKGVVGTLWAAYNGVAEYDIELSFRS